MGLITWQVFLLTKKWCRYSILGRLRCLRKIKWSPSTSSFHGFNLTATESISFMSDWASWCFSFMVSLTGPIQQFLFITFRKERTAAAILWGKHEVVGDLKLVFSFIFLFIYKKQMDKQETNAVKLFSWLQQLFSSTSSLKSSKKKIVFYWTFELGSNNARTKQCTDFYFRLFFIFKCFLD